MSSPTSSKTIDSANWQKILQTMRTRNAVIEGLLRAAEPIGVNDKILTIGVFYRFHKEKLEQPTTKKILEEVICDLIQDKDIHVDFLLTEKKPVQPINQATSSPINESPESLTPKVDADIISAAKEIFG